MSISLYAVSVPVFVKTLSNLKGVLQKAKAHALENKIEESAFINARRFANCSAAIAERLRKASAIGRITVERRRATAWKRTAKLR